MSTRRRFKPAVNLAPRRTASSAPAAAAANRPAAEATASAKQEQPQQQPPPPIDLAPPTVESTSAATAADADKSAAQEAQAAGDADVLKATTTEQSAADSADPQAPQNGVEPASASPTPAAVAPDVSDEPKQPEPTAVDSPATAPAPAAAKLPARRLKPAVCLPVRKRKAPGAPAPVTPATAASAATSPTEQQSPPSAAAEFAVDEPSTSASSDVQPFKTPATPATTTSSPASADAATSEERAAESIKLPASPVKTMRQRIRPTPCLSGSSGGGGSGGAVAAGNRRNSFQGSNEPDVPNGDGEPPANKRQRLISTNSISNGGSPTDPVDPSQSSPATSQSSLSAPLSEHHHSQSASQPHSQQSQRSRLDSESDPTAPAVQPMPAHLLHTLISHKPKKSATRSDESQRIAAHKRDFQQRFNGQQPDKARLTMFDMIFYNPTSNPMKNPAVKPAGIRSRRGSNASSVASEAARSAISGRSAGSATAGKVVSGAASVASGGGGVVVKNGRRTSTESNESLVSRSSSSNSGGAGSARSSVGSVKREPEPEMMMPVPQLKLGPNGEMVLDEKSLVIETTGDKEARATLANAEIVYDDEFSGTSGFYKRNKRTRDWPADETIRFYRCLHTIGTDFSLMLTLFPNRSRRDLKLKFKKEERVNPGLINKALLHPNRFDIDELKRDFEREEAELVEMRAKWEEEKLRKIEEKKAMQRAISQNVRDRKAAKSCKSIAQRNMCDGELIYAISDANPNPSSRRRKVAKNPEVTVCPDFQHVDVNMPVVNSGEDEPMLPEISQAAAAPTTLSAYPVGLAKITSSIITDSASSHSPRFLPTSCETDMFSDQYVEPSGGGGGFANEARADAECSVAAASAAGGSTTPEANENDILNMEIVFVGDHGDVHILPDGNCQLSPSASSSSSWSSNLAAPADNVVAEQQQQSPTVVNWSEVIINGMSALPEIAHIQHNNVVLYDASQVQRTPLKADAEQPLFPTSSAGSCSDFVLDIRSADSAETIVTAPPEPLDVKPGAYAAAAAGSPNCADTMLVDCGEEVAEEDEVIQPEARVIKSEPVAKKIDAAIEIAAEPAAPLAKAEHSGAQRETEQEGEAKDEHKPTSISTTEASGCSEDEPKNTDAEIEANGDDNAEENDNDDDDDDDDEDDLAGLVDSLVVVARQDADGNVVHEVFLMSPTTGQLSEEPLDLPADVIDRIKASLVVP